MSERKVLNKYYPPDFDPEKLPRRKREKNLSYVVRLMAPFSMRCNTCGEYIYKGKKFNARKEDAVGENYLGIQIYRFYIRCPLCSREIAFKTDPKSTDYVCESGASRNFEPWRDADASEEEKKRRREEEEENNPMKALENRTYDSKKEIQNMDQLDELRSLNAHKETLDIEQVIHERYYKKDEEEDLDQKEEDELVKKAFSKKTSIEIDFSDSDSDNENEKKPVFFGKKKSIDLLTSQPSKGPESKKPKLSGLIVKKKDQKEEKKATNGASKKEETKKEVETVSSNGGGLLGLGEYSD